MSYPQHLADAPVHRLQVPSEVGPFFWRCRFDVGSFEGVVFIHLRLLAELYVGSLCRLQRCCLCALSCLHTIIIPIFSRSLTPDANKSVERTAAPLSAQRRLAHPPVPGATLAPAITLPGRTGGPAEWLRSAAPSTHNGFLLKALPPDWALPPVRREAGPTGEAGPAPSP
jgi:hypothetical protein